MCVLFLGIIRRREKYAAGHAEMEKDAAFVFHMENQIFSAPSHGGKGLAQKAAAEILVRGMGDHLRPVCEDAFNGEPAKLRLKDLFHGFDFGKFRHDAHSFLADFLICSW